MTEILRKPFNFKLVFLFFNVFMWFVKLSLLFKMNCMILDIVFTVLFLNYGSGSSETVITHHNLHVCWRICPYPSTSLIDFYLRGLFKIGKLWHTIFAVLDIISKSLTEFLLAKISFVLLTLGSVIFAKCQLCRKLLCFQCFNSKLFNRIQLCAVLAAGRNCLYSKCSVSCQCGYWLLGNQRARTCYWYIITCQPQCKNHLHSKLHELHYNVKHFTELATWSCKWWWGSRS